MNKLRTTSQFLDPDAAYFALLEAHHGLSDEQSAQLNACLVLILANHIGDREILDQAIALAKR